MAIVSAILGRVEQAIGTSQKEVGQFSRDYRRRRLNRPDRAYGCISPGGRLTALDSFTDYDRRARTSPSPRIAGDAPRIESDYPRSTFAQSSRTSRSCFTWRLSPE